MQDVASKMDSLTSETRTSRGMPWSHAFSAKVFGDPATVELEQRLFAGVMLVALASGIVATIQTLALGLAIRMMVPAVVCTLVSLAGFWLTRVMRQWRWMVTPFLLFILLLLAASWITEAGTGGTIAFYFFLIIGYAAVFFEGAKKAISVGAVLATVAALSIVEYRFPSIMLPYANARERFADVVLTLPLCLFLLAFFVYRVYGEYQRERRAKDELLRLMTAERDRVERSMREKRRLLSIVSHDIANALTVLQGGIELARMPQRSAQVGAETLERMEYACGNIGEIISSVRMMESVEQGLVTFEPKRTDLQAVFKTAEVLFAEHLRQRDIRIVFPELRADNRFVMADPRILANHVFSNLVSNAIKFSHRSSTIVVSVEREAEQTVIRVADRGIGMPPALVAKLFDLDAKTTRPGTDGRPGTGFGLRTVKSFVDLFGGTISVESNAEDAFPEEHGTVVTLRLPSCPPTVFT
jgi:signal transduction histidine kinase